VGHRVSVRVHLMIRVGSTTRALLRPRGLAMLGMVTMGAAVLSACGSSTRASTTSTTATGGSSTTAAPTGSSVPSGTVSGLDLSKLGSLTNYTGTMTDNGESISVSVNSPTNWQETLGNIPTLHIDGFSYGKSINAQGQSVWYKNADSPDEYQQSPYPGAVAQFSGFTKVGGASIVRGAACTVAGVTGHTWTIKSPTTGTLTERESACVADQSGALLSLSTSASGSAVPSNGFAYTYTMDTVGGVPATPVPSPVQGG
jgi:hypothetical protein